MKEQPEPQTDPILEECYRMKAEFAAQFNSIEELYDYLKAREQERKAQGKIYIDPPRLPRNRARKTKIRFYIETFGKEELEIEEPALDVFVTEVNI